MHPKDAGSRCAGHVPAILCDQCADVSDLLSWSLSRVHLYHLCGSSERGTNVSDAHNTRTNYFTYLEQESVILLLWKTLEAMRGSLKMFVGANEVCTTATHARENHSRANQDRRTDRNTHTHLAGRSATYWAHLGGFHNLRGTVATHAQVRTRQKQM